MSMRVSEGGGEKRRREGRGEVRGGTFVEKEDGLPEVAILSPEGKRLTTCK